MGTAVSVSRAVGAYPQQNGYGGYGQHTDGPEAYRSQYEQYRSQGGLLEFLQWQELNYPVQKVPYQWRQNPRAHYNDPSRRYQVPSYRL